jgi:hypothetical protein
MQLLSTIALLVSALLLQPSDAETESHIHLRVATGGASQQKAAEWQQCKWIDKTASCDSGLTCVVQNDYYGQCIKKQADLWGQCGGYGWTGTCVSGATCQKKDDYYSQCVPSSSGGGPGEVEWAQCHWESYDKKCASGLQCAVESKWYGQCVKKQADVWGQCAGPNWTATCKSGKCVKQNDNYSQCKP